MSLKFNHILVLVDYSPSSIHAAEEAALLASRFDSQIHLVHILAKQGIDPENGEDKYYERIEKLEKVKIHLKKIYGVQAKCHLAIGEFYEMIKKIVQDLAINLIVVGVKRKHWLKDFLFESAAQRIIKSVQVEVLSVYPKTDPKKIKKIVLPIGKFVPERGIKIAYELSKKFGAILHLVLITRSNDGENADSKNLITSYFFIKEFTNMPVQCKSISGNDLAEATLSYANLIDADMILMDSGNSPTSKDAKLHKWINTLVSRSFVPVLNI